MKNISAGRVSKLSILGVFCASVVVVTVSADSTVVSAQDAGLEPGEAFVTRFSGTIEQPGPDNQPVAVIDPQGVVGVVVDLGHPGVPPMGQRWQNVPQRAAITAEQVGQVFGIAIDDAEDPNVYVAATPVYGLSLLPDQSGWMPGQWGPLGPGGIYRLNAANDLRPEPFATITLDGRPNGGAALGNIAYDRWHRQLYVSDLETGMIHRIGVEDAADLGHWDHGASGRPNFVDAATGQPASLPPLAFDPESVPMAGDCPDGEFARSPSCWNLADFRRRVWGLGVHRDEATDTVRLYYSVWGSQGFGNDAWDAAGPDQRNSIWSVAIAEDGSFDGSDVRREIVIPGFFSRIEDFERAGGSNPVTDIAFSASGSMLLAERGGLRNLGPGAPDAFAWPYESRVMRFDPAEDGTWQPAGRYDVGFYDRKDHGQPWLRAAGTGGVDFGFGYGPDGILDPEAVDGFVWSGGAGLCSPGGPCLDPATGANADPGPVSGLQGSPVDAPGEFAPPEAYQPYPQPGPAVPAAGLDRAYMVDLFGDDVPAGDIEVYRAPGAPPVQAHIPPGSIHLPVGSMPGHQAPASLHLPVGSFAGHDFPWSIHQPIGSGPVHQFPWSIHHPIGSGPIHQFPWSIHLPLGSKPQHQFPWSIHLPLGSQPQHLFPWSIHLPLGSKPQHQFPWSIHLPIGSLPQHKFPQSVHLPLGSQPQHQFPWSIHLPLGSQPQHKFPQSIHLPLGSQPQHKFPQSIHLPLGSQPQHKFPQSIHLPLGSQPQHKFPQSIHLPLGSKPQHKLPQSIHLPIGSKPVHKPVGSVIHLPIGSKPVHKPAGSIVHLPIGSKPVHKPVGSVIHLPIGSKPVHKPAGSIVHLPIGSKPVHKPTGSKPVHRPVGSKIIIHKPVGSRIIIHKPVGSVQVHKPRGSVHKPTGSKVIIKPPVVRKPIVRPVPGQTVKPRIIVPRTTAPNIQLRTIEPNP